MKKIIDRRILSSILSQSKKISTKTEINSLLKKYLKSQYSPNIFNYITKRGMIKNIFLSYYYILDSDEQLSKYTKYSSLEMVAEVLNSIKTHWYLGLDSAVKTHGLIWQGISTTIIINSKFSGSKTILGSKYIFKKTIKPIKKTSLLKKGYGTKTIYFSDKERTLIDYIYFKKRPPMSLIKSIDHNTLLRHLANYSKEFKKKVLYYE